MTTIIKEFGAEFLDNGFGPSATLIVPNGTTIISLKFYENAPRDIGQVIAVVGLLSDPQSTPGTHNRLFTMIPDSAPIPANFKKYIATVPYGPNKEIMHVIEIFATKAEHGDFNPDSATISDI